MPGEAPDYRNLKHYDEDKSRGNKRRRDEEPDNGQVRLNRYIANAGVCSRRDADALIAAGEIKVNGEVVTEMGYQVQPADTVQYGKTNLNREKQVYVLLNKPKDFITTTDDPEGRRTVMDLVATASKERIFPVGRLDRNTTGLLLFTNDGEVAQKLSHPSHKNKKIYQVELDKPLTEADLKQIAQGVELEDGRAEIDDVARSSRQRALRGHRAAHGPQPHRAPHLRAPGLRRGDPGPRAVRRSHQEGAAPRQVALPVGKRSHPPEILHVARNSWPPAGLLTVK